MASLGLSSVAVGAGVTKVAPTQAEPGHPFTLIDTGLARLVDGSEAIFQLAGIQVVIPLDTHKPYNTAQGRLPRDIGGGTYTVLVRPPGGSQFEIGSFTVFGTPAVTAPFVEPTCGPAGTPFVITDSQGRMAGADRIVFTRSGDAFQNGMLAEGISVNAEGTRATALVPRGLDAMAYNLTVHAGDPATPVFGALLFVIAGDEGLCP